MKVFVYGTLKSGYGNNRLLSSSKFLGTAVVKGYKLFNSGFPVATHDENSSVVGEVWEIDEGRTLSNLDALESYPHFYGRDTVDAMLDSVQGYECQMYVGNPKSWRNFNGLKECPVNENGHYYWDR